MSALMYFSPPDGILIHFNYWPGDGSSISTQNLKFCIKNQSISIHDKTCHGCTNNQTNKITMDQSYLIFVYGTLKRNQPNHHYLTNSEFVTEAKSFEKFPLVIASKYNIPFCIEKAGTGNRIKGEIFKVDTPTLVKLDELENHPTLYVRQVQKFEATDGRTIEAWIYLLKQYKPDMLELEFYESYDSEGSHGKQYVPSEDDLQKPEEIMDVLKSN